jgi:hypothetical protein
MTLNAGQIVTVKSDGHAVRLLEQTESGHWRTTDGWCYAADSLGDATMTEQILYAVGERVTSDLIRDFETWEKARGLTGAGRAAVNGKE